MKRKKEILIGAACFVLAAVFVFSVFNTPKPPDEEQSFAMGSPLELPFTVKKTVRQKRERLLKR